MDKAKTIQTEVKSRIGLKAKELNKEWLHDIDTLIKENIQNLTCDNVRELYYSLFHELKDLRSNSSGFTGFSEFLVFRALYHTIGEDFEQSKIGTSDNASIVFKSKNYVLEQSVAQKLNGTNIFPDICIKQRKGESETPIGIIQIKIISKLEPTMKREIQTIEKFKEKHPKIKGLFISYVGKSFTEENKQKLKEAGYTVEVLYDNQKLISNVLKTVI